MRRIWLWSIAVALTLGAAVYQRLTGPTHPMSVRVVLGGEARSFLLPRSHGGEGDAVIELDGLAPSVAGTLHYRRLGVGEAFVEVPLGRVGDGLRGALPHQPPAGKLEYFFTLTHTAANERVRLPEDRAVVIRFRGGVPASVLVPHVLLMFLAMLLSSRAAVEALAGGARLALYATLAFGALVVGGLVLGPIVQRYAFGELWTGVPFGYDLTDNKTLVATVVWAAALYFVRWGSARAARAWVVAAALVLLVIFSIPHSMWGSQLDYGSGRIDTGAPAD